MVTENIYAEIILSLPIEKTFHYRIPPALTAKARTGMRVEVPFGPKRLTGYILALLSECAVENPRDILSLMDDEPVVTGELMQLARWISANYVCSLGEALGSVIPGVLRAPQKISKRSTLAAAEPARLPGVPFKLNSAQQEAVSNISASITGKKHAVIMLYGITGSGKTEVYLAAIAETLKAGRTAVFLLPEISLTPQFITIVKNRFPGIVGIWHSKIPAGEKYKTWSRARGGEIKIMLGARSAVFAPLKNVGLIIVDEEHEPSYKQEQKPAYHTREVAIERARLNDAVVVFGSATPSLEMFYKAKAGEITLLELPQRIDNRPLPGVRIVDSSLLHRKSKILSEAAVEAMSRVLARREQAIVFLNRRGFSPGVMCRQCGKVFQCPHCSVSLVYHRSPEELRCHYCDYRLSWPGVCPGCRSREISAFGVGTQKVEEELKKIFPQAKVLRLDKDTTRKAGVYETAYRDFKDENFDILLGTQMVAKGFDFPRVTLVAVVDADTALYLPDFRASERTFQILTQVSGRSGRSSLGGEVVIQTRHPEHYVLKASLAHDYPSFYEHEIGFRRELRYPPFTHIVNVVLRAKKEEKAKEAAEEAAEIFKALKEEDGASFELLGPSQASRAKLHGYFRWQLVLKGPREELLKAARTIKDSDLPSGAILSVDVDPQSML